MIKDNKKIISDVKGQTEIRTQICMVPPIQANGRIYIQTLAFSGGVKVKHADMGERIQIWTFTSRCYTVTRSNEFEVLIRRYFQEKEALPKAF